MQKIRLPMLALASLTFAGPNHSGAETFQEDFSNDPQSHGWKAFGEAGLFGWNSAEQNLEVTWDSSKSNSYFHRPLGTILTKSDDFTFAFDLRLRDIAVGTTPQKPYTFQIAIGFVSWADATRTNFFRGTGFDSPNVVEFDYFPDSGFGATIAPTIISRSNQFATSFNFPDELTTNDLFHIEMSYTASNRTLATVMTRNGQPFGPIDEARQAPGFDDFRVDHVAVCSYSDAGQDPMFAGSVLAHGTVDNLIVTTPPLPVRDLRGEIVDGQWEVQFLSQPDWLYTFERTADIQIWTAASPTISGDGGTLILRESVPEAGATRFYRVRAERP